jgi:hypothetical protein
MSDQDRPYEDAALQASPELVNDLKQLRKETLLVPPQIDAAALSRPRLHLAHVRDMRAHGRMRPGASAEDLPLAARASAERERLAGRVAPRGEDGAGPPRERLGKLILLVAVAAGAVLLSWFLLRWLLYH